MKKLVFTFIIVLLTGIFAANTSAQSMKQIKQQIKQINKIMVEATINKDAKAMAEYYTDDFIGMPNMMPMLNGKEAAIAADEEMNKSDVNFTQFELNTMEVFKGGDFVYEIGTWNMVMEIPGVPEPWKDHGKYLTVWEIQKDKTIKLKADIWNTDTNPWEAMKQMQHQHQTPDKKSGLDSDKK